MKNIIILLFVSISLFGCSDPYGKPATTEQLKNFQKVLTMFPSLKEDYSKAESDGVVTKGELVEIANKAKVIRESREEK